MGQTAEQTDEAYEGRRQLLRALSDARGGTVVVTYITSTRPQLSASMAADAIPVIHEHLRLLDLDREKAHIDLFLHTDGGDGVVPWRLMTLLREFAAEISVLVPHRCFSAGTLTALGADRVLMHPMGVLGPTDPTSHTAFNPTHPIDKDSQVGVAVEDVTAYVQMVKEDVGITESEELMLAFSVLAGQVHPLALGNVKRLSQQMQMMGEKMLGLRNGETVNDASAVVRKLNSELFVHGHPINRSEARKEIGLSFVEDASSDVERAMWDLYEAYAAQMRLHEEFDLFAEAVGEVGLPDPPTWTKGRRPPPPRVQTARVPGVKYVYVESAARSDCREFDLEITAARYWNGAMDAQSVVFGSRWTTVWPAQAPAVLLAGADDALEGG